MPPPTAGSLPPGRARSSWSGVRAATASWNTCSAAPLTPSCPTASSQSSSCRCRVTGASTGPVVLGVDDQGSRQALPLTAQVASSHHTTLQPVTVVHFGPSWTTAFDDRMPELMAANAMERLDDLLEPVTEQHPDLTGRHPGRRQARRRPGQASPRRQPRGGRQPWPGRLHRSAAGLDQPTHRRAEPGAGDGRAQREHRHPPGLTRLTTSDASRRVSRWPASRTA